MSSIRSAINPHSRSQAPSETRVNLKRSMSDGAGFSLMVAFGESYFPAFVLAVGLSDVTAGLITTVPLLVGAVLQLISPIAVYWLNSNKRWVVAATTVQALSFVPLIFAATVGHIPGAAMYLMASIYWAMGMAAGPAWSAWIDGIVPKRLRTKFFARRNRMMQILSLAGFVAGGWFLESKPNDSALMVFAVFFTIAGICRFVSARYLASQTESSQVEEMRIISPQDLSKRLGGSREGRLLVYLLSVQFAAFTSAPYFSPYMLTDLKLPYGPYAALIGSATFAKILMLGFADRLARRFGIRNLLIGCGIAIVPLPALWLITQHYGWLLVFQMIGGASWGLFELTSFLLLFEAIPRQERTSILTLYNLANASAIVCGSLIGGAILTPSAQGLASNYHAVFAASTCVRAVTLFLLYRLVKAERLAARQKIEEELALAQLQGNEAGLPYEKGRAS